MGLSNEDLIFGSARHLITLLIASLSSGAHLLSTPRRVIQLGMAGQPSMTLLNAQMLAS
jgi:hypothetical protein